jgi:Mrp family chromosome partitioning ATPase
MTSFLDEVKRDFYNWTVIFDLPPILSSDDVLTMLPRLDCVAFVVGAGTTTIEQIKECNRHFESTEVIRVVLNKSEDTTANYSYSYGHAGIRGKARGKQRPDRTRAQPPSADLSQPEETRWDKPPPDLGRSALPPRRAPRFKRFSRMINRLGRP